MVAEEHCPWPGGSLHALVHAGVGLEPGESPRAHPGGCGRTPKRQSAFVYANVSSRDIQSDRIEADRIAVTLYGRRNRRVL